MTQRLITHLRHIDLGVPDFAEQLRFYTQTWGLTAEHTDTGIAFLAAQGSPEQYIVRLREAADKRIDLIAFGAASAADVDTLAARLAGDGVALVSEPDALQTPGGGYGFRFFDNEGRTVEISCDVQVRQHRRIEAGEDIPVRLSHIVINSTQPEATRAFYEKHLAFALSDTLMHPRMGEMMWFMRVNRWHHSLAIARGPHAALHHASFELRGVDEYMRGTGRLLRAGVEKIWGPGRHLAGNNTFSYFLDPIGNTVEYTTELEQLDEDSWHPHMYDFSQPVVADQWGTANQMNEFVAEKSYNDPDKGLFVAPPGLMRFASYAHRGATYAGVVEGAGVHVLPHHLSVLDVVRAKLPAAIDIGRAALAAPAVPLEDVRLLPPLQAPTVRDFVAFEEHVEGVVASVGDGTGVVAEWYEAPTFYFTNPYALLGAYDDVAIPPGSKLFDYELEVAAVVGAAGASLTPEQARSHIFGYTILNDWSARDLQRREMKVNLGPAKGKDSASTLGPWIVTADELDPYRDDEGFLALSMSVSVNGTRLGQDLLSNMGWPFEELVAYASRGTTVRAGDVLGSGTCGNGGCLAELWGRRGRVDPPPLQPGDVVEMTVEGIGTIRNRVVEGVTLSAVRAARPRPRARTR